MEFDEDLIKIEYFETDEQDPLELSQENGNKYTPYAFNVEVEIKHDNSNTNIETEDIDFCIPKKSVGNETDCWYKDMDDTGNYLCMFCSLKYASVQTLRYHVVKKHPVMAKLIKEKIMKKTRNRKFKCRICASNFPSLPYLEKHMSQVHKIDKSTSFCSKCYAVFDDINQLCMHYRIEHGILYTKVYACNICGYQTHRSSNLKTHLKTHSEIKNHKCEHCDYATDNLPNLKIHERLHNDLKPYKCSDIDCKFSSATKSSLRRHLLKHNRESNNMFHCDKCMYKTVYKEHLIRHANSHTRGTARIVL